MGLSRYPRHTRPPDVQQQHLFKPVSSSIVQLCVRLDRLRPEHFRQMFESGCMPDSYTAAERQMRLGWIPPSVRSWYCAAIGLAFYKPNNALRPLNIRNVWLRHSGRCFLNEHRHEHAALFLSIGQTAIGVPGAAEIVCHCLRLLWQQPSANIGASFDGSNAFGTMSRILILKGLLKRAPE